ncbi:MAG: hypothetical protein DGJ47_000679 [Rickettsiaceae bacterium]
MPQATAVWLVDNTSLTFKQIANFCGMHELEIKGIADGDVCTSVKGLDPIVANQLTQEELDRCSNDLNASLQLKVNSEYDALRKKANKRTKYIPIARRQDKPDAVYWLVKNHPEIKDSDIIKLVGTTKTTLEAIKDRSHWNMSQIRQRDPVLLGICSQIDLDRVIEKSKIDSAAKNDKK